MTRWAWVQVGVGVGIVVAGTLLGCSGGDGGAAAAPAVTVPPESGPADAGSEGGVIVRGGNPEAGSDARPSPTDAGAADGERGDGGMSEAGADAASPDDAADAGGPPRVVEVAPSGDHACVRWSDGSVECWGWNWQGALGIDPGDAGPETGQPPVRIAGITDAIQLAGGTLHTCALRANGTVLCWGSNTYAALGDGQFGSTQGYSATPVLVAGLTDAVEIQAGAGLTCARRLGGSLVCWGEQAAEPADAGLWPVPTPVPGIDDAQSLAVGGIHACAIRSDRSVWCWGDNQFGEAGQLADGGPPEFVEQPSPVAGVDNAVEVAAGSYHTCARRSDGTILCWGADLFTPESVNDKLAPLPPTVIPGVTDAAQLAAGVFSTCARQTAGSLLCWGLHFYGSLGDGQSGLNFAYSTVPGVSNVLTVRAGSLFGTTCAVTGSGEVDCWGSNFGGEVERPWRYGATSPLAIPNFTATGVTMGWYSACATGAGSVSCWGTNNSGTLASANSSADFYESSPTAVSLADVDQVAAGLYHACALVQSDVPLGGFVACWGDNSVGEVGSGTTSSSPVTTPTLIPEASKVVNVVQVAAGGWTSCARRRDGSVYCWGAGYGATPEQVNGVLGSTDLCVGEVQACAVVNGEVYCWSQATNAAPVYARNDAIQVACGQQHTCLLRQGGSVECWGDNSHGQLGDGTFTSGFAIVSNLTDAVRIAAGGWNSCAVRANGDVMCWGQASLLGLPATTDANVPQGPVPGISGAIQISLAGSDACAVVPSGTVSCWGLGLEGLLGDGTVLYSTTPVTITWL